MKILNFTAVEILPALLNKSKCQTIRPAWKKIKIPVIESASDFLQKARMCVEKPARFKVGEKVQLGWKVRGTPKDAVFCSVCGEEFPKASTGCGIADSWHKHKRPLIVFPKLLGTATITETFQIKIQEDTDYTTYPFGFGIFRLDTGERLDSWDVEEFPNIVKFDGFKNTDGMFKYFDKKYDLSSPKKFHCIRWQWL